MRAKQCQICWTRNRVGKSYCHACKAVIARIRAVHGNTNEPHAEQWRVLKERLVAAHAERVAAEMQKKGASC